MMSFSKLCLANATTIGQNFEGFIEINKKDYFVSVYAPHYPLAKDIDIRADAELEEFIHKSNLEYEKIQDDCTVEHYLKNLQKSCCDYVVGNGENLSIHSIKDEFEFISVLLRHIDVLGWDKVEHVAPDFSLIVLHTLDEKQRRHHLRLKISSTYPSQSPEPDADIPLESDALKKLVTKKELCSLYESWRELLQSFQTFWDVVDDIDESVLVLDPAKPTRKDTTRRILLENGVSVHILISPEHAISAPKFQLLGPSSVVGPLNEKLLELYQTWDESESIIYNLEHGLRLKVVQRTFNPDLDEDELDVCIEGLDIECGVCYCLRLNDDLADSICDHCRKHFHLWCLYDWLKSLPSSQHSGQYIRGDCPFCTKPISCKIPS